MMKTTIRFSLKSDAVFDAVRELVVRADGAELETHYAEIDCCVL